MQSQLDLAANIPGTAGTIASYVIDATGLPRRSDAVHHPEADRGAADGQIKNAIAARDAVRRRLPERSHPRGGADVRRQDAGARGALGQVTTDWHARGARRSTAPAARQDDQGPALRDRRRPRRTLAFADHGIAETRAPGLAVTLSETGALAIGEHAFALRYGQLMRLALDAGADPADRSGRRRAWASCSSGAVNCKAVGRYIHEAIGFGSASTFEGGLHRGAHRRRERALRPA